MAESTEDIVVINAVDAVQTRKDPPPEAPERIRARRLVICAFWAVAILLGLPIWWKSTTVYRADLPLQLMTDWADGKICSPALPLLVEVDTLSLPREHGEAVVQATREAYRSLAQASMLDMRLNSNYDQSMESSDGYQNSQPKALTVKLSASKSTFWSSKANENPSVSIQPHSNVLDISYGKSMESESDFASVLGAYVAGALQEYLAEEQTILSDLMSALTPSESAKYLSLEVAESVARRPTRAFRYATTYHLTFSLFTPEAWPSSWEIEKALEETFTPLLAALSSVSNFTVETQVQPYATLSPSLQPVYDEKLKAWTIPREELGGFINAAEWPLSPSIGKGPTIHFVLFVASAGQSPLVVQSSNRNSWLVPQWGGITIHNPGLKPGASNPPSLTSSDLQPALLRFSNHLLALLGVPSTPPESFPLRLATLTRIRAASVFLTASSTLGSLARVVSGLPSISIPDSVADNVSSTLEHLNVACKAFRAGNFGEALRNAREADTHAEKAFFEKSMVGQVYFPDEHKVAVYLPLLGPVAVPLLVSGIKEIRPFLQRLRGR